MIIVFFLAKDGVCDVAPDISIRAVEVVDQISQVFLCGQDDTAASDAVRLARVPRLVVLV